MTQMKRVNHIGMILALLIAQCALLVSFVACSRGPDERQAAAVAPATNVALIQPAGLVPLILKLPDPAFKGTPPELKVDPNVEPLSDKDRPPMLVPAGLKNIALMAKLSCSDTNASEGLAKIIDGDKEASEQAVVYLRKGTQWVQMDFGSAQVVFAIVTWHAHNMAKVYHDVLVRASDEPTFATGARTQFNNDQDNSSGLGIGTDREYFETREGKLIDAKGVRCRYLRFYSRGSTESALNEYTEIEVYGRPVQ